MARECVTSSTALLDVVTLCSLLGHGSGIFDHGSIESRGTVDHDRVRIEDRVVYNDLCVNIVGTKEDG